MTVIAEQGHRARGKRVRNWLGGKGLDQRAGVLFQEVCRQEMKSLEEFEKVQGAQMAEGDETKWGRERQNGIHCNVFKNVLS